MNGFCECSLKACPAGTTSVPRTPKPRAQSTHPPNPSVSRRDDKRPENTTAARPIDPSTINQAYPAGMTSAPRTLQPRIRPGSPEGKALWGPPYREGLGGCVPWVPGEYQKTISVHPSGPYLHFKNCLYTALLEQSSIRFTGKQSTTNEERGRTQ